VDPTNLAPSEAVPVRTILATSGQPLHDMCKYVPTVPTTRLDLAEATLKWRHIGCQPRFATRLVEDGKRRSRVVLVPSFAQTGILVLVGLKSLDVRIVRLTEDILPQSA